jgi:hypothetical protein
MTSLAWETPTARFHSRLAAAELLKLRKRRGLVATVSLMTVGAAVFTYALLAILHAANPAHHGPAGGTGNLGHGVFLLSLLGAVAAAIVGGTAGADDWSSGVFRELVVTGRSRWALFRARIPGGLAFLLPFIAVAYAVSAVASVVFAGSRPVPATGTLVSGGLWLLLSVAFYYLLALGLASALGSRSQTIGILLAWRLALTPLLISISAFGIGREFVPGVALQRFAPHALEQFMRQGPVVSTSLAAAFATLVVWTVVALGVGAWRTATRDA